MKKETVLIVDDEENIRKTLYYNLNDRGYNVLTAANSEEALNKLNENKISVVLSDIVMNNSCNDGVKLLDKIKKIDKYLPVILFTGYSSIETSIPAVNLGAFAYLKKPVNIEKIIETLESALEKYNKDKQKNKIFAKYFNQLFMRKQKIKDMHTKDGIIENDMELAADFDNFDKIKTGVMTQNRYNEAKILIISKHNILTENIRLVLKKERFTNFNITDKFNVDEISQNSILIVDADFYYEELIKNIGILREKNPAIKILPMLKQTNATLQNALFGKGLNLMFGKPVGFDEFIKIVSWQSFLVKQEAEELRLSNMNFLKKIAVELKYFLFKEINWKIGFLILIIAAVAGFFITRLSHPKLKKILLPDNSKQIKQEYNNFIMNVDPVEQLKFQKLMRKPTNE